MNFPSSYYPPRARWKSGVHRGWWWSFRRRRAQARIASSSRPSAHGTIAAIREFPWAAAGLHFFLPGYGFRNGRVGFRIFIWSYALAFLLFLGGLGLWAGNVGLALMISMLL